MKNRLYISMFIACVLLSSVILGAWAQTESLGVKSGDNFAYNFVVNWSSTDINTIVPQQFSDWNQTLSIHVNVTDVGVTMAYVNVTNTLRGGSSSSEPGYIDVSTGRGTPNAQILIIAANLTAGSQVYPLSNATEVEKGVSAASFTITETVNKTYLGASRETNHYSETLTNSTTGDYIQRNLYYEKATGVLLEMTITHYFASVQETDSEHWTITRFNNAEAPSDGTDGTSDGTTSNNGLPSWLLPVVIAGVTVPILPVIIVAVVIIALIAAVMLRRRRKPEEQPSAPTQTPTSAPPPGYEI